MTSTTEVAYKNIIKFDNNKFKLTKSGLRIIGLPTYKEWLKAGITLSQVNSAIPWWIGDWASHGQEHYGQKYKKAMGLTNLKYQTIANYVLVAGKIDFSRRRENLSFSHHAEVIALNEKQQDYYLNLAEKEDWSCSRLRTEIRKMLPNPSLPKGKFRVILADPPWSYDYTNSIVSAEQHYPIMQLEEICQLPIEKLTTEETVLFLWTTNPLLFRVPQVLESWKFTYKSSIVWVKNRGASLGLWMNSRHELLLMCTKESTPLPLEKINSVVSAKHPGKHSQKPRIFHEIIEKMYKGPYLELFGRRRRKGWTVWGNEIE